MIKNTAGQKIGAQMIAAADGTAFTGAVTVSVTGDAGTQATGSVGAGACTHEGNGYHTYAPAQAETNHDLIAFTFTGSGAIPVTVQVFTIAGDAFTRLGAPAGASVSADILTIDNLVDDLESRIGTPSNLGGGATVAANLADIEAQTDDIGTAGAGLTALGDTRLANLDATVSSRLATSGYTAPPTAAANADAVWDEATSGHTTGGTFGEQVKTDVDAILADTNELQTDWVNGGRLDTILDATFPSSSYTAPLTAAGTRTALGLASANLDTQIGDLPTNSELSTALAAADDAVLAAIAALNNLSSAQAQTAAAAALAAYDPPTNAEMEARTLTAALIAKLTAHLGGVLTGVVGSGSTPTELVLNASTGINGAAPSSVNDFYNGRVVVFLTGTLSGQATSISDYIGSTVTMTIVGVTGAPQAGDTFIVV